MTKNIFFICFLLLLMYPLISEGQGEKSLSLEVKLDLSGRRPNLVEAINNRIEERKRMILRHMLAREIYDTATLTGILHVPRHIFVLPQYKSEAYSDTPLPIGYGQTISQPYIVAFMTSFLNIKPGDKVLEIGTGSGYQGAVLSELTDRVYTIEIIRDLYKKTKTLYERYGYDAKITTKQGDGYFGWESEAPFDAIIVTAAAGHVPPPLMAQLKPGGKLILPLGGVYTVQMLVLISKDLDGELTTEQLLPVRFVPLTGSILDDTQ